VRVLKTVQLYPLRDNPNFRPERLASTLLLLIFLLTHVRDLDDFVPVHAREHRSGDIKGLDL
jgi:hypothetical protein